MTPKSIRIRKRFLKEHERKRASRESAVGSAGRRRLTQPPSLRALARRIAGTSTTRRVPARRRVLDRARSSAAIICASVTKPSRRAASRVGGNASASSVNGSSSTGQRCPGPSTYQGRRIVAVSPAAPIAASPCGTRIDIRAHHRRGLRHADVDERARCACRARRFDARPDRREIDRQERRRLRRARMRRADQVHEPSRRRSSHAGRTTDASSALADSRLLAPCRGTRAVDAARVIAPRLAVADRARSRGHQRTARPVRRVALRDHGSTSIRPMRESKRCIAAWHTTAVGGAAAYDRQRISRRLGGVRPLSARDLDPRLANAVAMTA